MNPDLVSGLEFLLVEGARDDFVELRLLAFHVADLLGISDSSRRYDALREAEVREGTLRVVSAALGQGLARVASFDERSGALSAWELPHEQIVATLDTKWRELGRPMSLYDVACIELTESGRRAGRMLAAAPTSRTRLPS